MTEPTRLSNLRCEYRVTPLGLDEARPRLSWELVTARRGARQTAWRVRVSSQQGGPADLWDSGRVAGDQSTQVVYGGRPLCSRERVWWRVEAWDERRQVARAGSWWEMGLLRRNDWKASWIAADYAGGPRSFAPAPCLRRAFRLPGGARRARLYVSALGLFECRLNGVRVGDDVFAPGWSDYRRRVYYQVYDVTDLLRAGENVLGAVLGSGWYSGHVAGEHRQMYGDRPRLFAQLEVTGRDGTSFLVASDGDWQFSPGPILDEDIIMGESYDARRDMAGWAAPGFTGGAAWRAVVVEPDPGLAIEARRGPLVRRQQELRPVAPPKELPTWARDRYLFDFGQNLVGRVRLRVRAPAGTTLILRHAEMLAADGELHTANLRTARATDHYTCRGGGVEVWEPSFTFHGFRYLELKGLRNPPASTATAIVLHSDLPLTGEFSCSDSRLNRLQRNIDWGLRGNFVDVPTDCPQRDERCGWTGDAQVFIRTAAFNRDVAAFFTKWQRDLADAQAADGAVAMFAPYWRPTVDDAGPAWADALVICPWVIHQRYGDERILADHFDSFRRFVDRAARHTRGGIRGHPAVQKSGGFGDWLAMDGSPGKEGRTPKDLIGTAFLAHSADLLARIAERLGRRREASRYRGLAARVRRAFRRRFFDRHGRLRADTQTAHVLALHFDLAPEKQRPALAAELGRMIAANGDRLATGFVGTPYLLAVLTRFGKLDLAYRLLLQTRCPSWLHAVVNGATTIWERWDGWTPERGFQDPEMNSFNHYAYGAVGEWLYGAVAGLDFDPEIPGGKRLQIHPRPGGTLRSAAARLRTPFGLAESRWKRTGTRLEVRVVVPPNTTAAVTLPFGRKAAVRCNGGPLRDSRHLRIRRRTRSATRVEVRAGHWVFSGPAEARP